jgi:selenophosphate synthase
MLQDSGCSAEIEKEKLPVLQGIEPIEYFVYPDMTTRNYNSVKPIVRNSWKKPTSFVRPSNERGIAYCG